MCSSAQAVASAEGATMDSAELPKIDIELGTDPGVDATMVGGTPVKATPTRVRAKSKDSNLPPSPVKDSSIGAAGAATGGSKMFSKASVIYGLGLSGLNPALLMTYTAALTTLYHHIREDVVFDLKHASCFALGVFLGVNIWLNILIVGLKRYKHRFRSEALSRGIQGLGLVLLILGMSLAHSMLAAATDVEATQLQLNRIPMGAGFYPNSSAVYMNRAANLEAHLAMHVTVAFPGKKSRGTRDPSTPEASTFEGSWAKDLFQFRRRRVTGSAEPTESRTP